jgi:HrpA-like RNA helicase
MSILKYREKILDAVRRERVLVISGKTGCGKSTQVPQMLLENDQRARIAVCEPRRLAATSLAEWVA